MQTIAVEMAMGYIFAGMNLLPIIFQKKAHTYVQRYKIFTDNRNPNLKVSCISPSFGFSRALVILTTLESLMSLESFEPLESLTSLKLLDSFIEKRQSMQGGNVGRRGATAAAENGWRGRQPMECG